MWFAQQVYLQYKEIINKKIYNKKDCEKSMSLILVFLISIMFFVPFALNKMRRVYLVIPFFLLSCLVIFNIGLFDKYSFLDSALIFHKTLVDTLIDPSLFQNDQAIEYYLKTYPRGYHLVLALLTNLKLSVAQSSKLLGIILALITPFLFYFLGLELYPDKQIAFFSAIFCPMALIGHTIYSGLPRSLGLVLFLIGLICLFKIKNKQKKIGYFAGLNLIMFLLVLIHPHTFIILWLVAMAFFLITFFEKNKTQTKLRADNAYLVMLLVLGGYVLGCWIFKQKNLINLSSWDFLHMHREIYLNRVPYVFMSFFRILQDIGIILLLMFASSLFMFSRNHELRKKYPDLRFLFIAVLVLGLAILAIMQINPLFFLKAHRFILFISLLMYLSGIWVLEYIWFKVKQNKVITALGCLILFAPNAIELRDHIQAPRFPYDLDKICFGITWPIKNPLKFAELLKLSDFISKNLDKHEMIACSLDRGDLLRMYAQRPVTASWEIGGMITTYRDAFFIYQQQIFNSEMLYSHPEELYKLYGVNYFVFEKSKWTNNSDLLTRFQVVWQSANIYFCKIII
ncbi:MAG: hypothetical protein KKD05_11050 [Candidatus Omnitrophica bacterium]|nr:hypothetical protein [Candidatus Omnitrophota bacterium]